MLAQSMFTEHKMTYTEKIIDLTTGEEIIREFTKEENDAVEKAIAENQKIVEKSEQKASEKTALLAKLGITEDEAKLLLS